MRIGDDWFCRRLEGRGEDASYPKRHATMFEPGESNTPRQLNYFKLGSSLLVYYFRKLSDRKVHEGMQIQNK